MKFEGLNAEQEALIKQLDLSDNISNKEIIEILEKINFEDTDPFVKSINEEIVNSIIEYLKTTS